jgi:endonuclease/exonuclease/phosphatase family metal-dependent hydrolase
MSDVISEFDLDFDDLDVPFPYILKTIKKINILTFNTGGLKTEYTKAKLKTIRKSADLANADVICLQHINLDSNAKNILDVHLRNMCGLVRDQETHMDWQ